MILINFMFLLFEMIDNIAIQSSLINKLFEIAYTRRYHNS